MIAPVMLLCTGLFSDKNVPKELEATLGDFGGESWHSSEWNHAVSLEGKHVVVVGAAASALQFVPIIAKQAAHTAVCQRSPSWVVPHLGRPVSGLQRALLRHVPGLRILQRMWQRIVYGSLGPLYILPLPSWVRYVIALTLSLPVLLTLGPLRLWRERKVFIPSYQIGCKRVGMSNHWYSTFRRGDAELVDVKRDPIERFTKTGVALKSGRAIPADVVILATGFRLLDRPIDRVVRGREGISITEAFPDGVRGLNGLTLRGFPNLFLVPGPGAYPGWTSALAFHDVMATYVVSAIEELQSRPPGSSIEPTEQAVEAFNKRNEAALERSVFIRGGCSSYYRKGGDSGRAPTLFGGSLLAFTWLLRTFRSSEYEFRAPSP